MFYIAALLMPPCQMASRIETHPSGKANGSTTELPQSTYYMPSLFSSV